MVKVLTVNLMETPVETLMMRDLFDIDIDSAHICVSTAVIADIGNTKSCQHSF